MASQDLQNIYLATQIGRSIGDPIAQGMWRNRQRQQQIEDQQTQQELQDYLQNQQFQRQLQALQLEGKIGGVQFQPTQYVRGIGTVTTPGIVTPGTEDQTVKANAGYRPYAPGVSVNEELAQKVRVQNLQDQLKAHYEAMGTSGSPIIDAQGNVSWIPKKLMPGQTPTAIPVMTGGGGQMMAPGGGIAVHQFVNPDDNQLHNYTLDKFGNKTDMGLAPVATRTLTDQGGGVSTIPTAQIPGQSPTATPVMIGTPAATSSEGIPPPQMGGELVPSAINAPGMQFQTMPRGKKSDDREWDALLKSANPITASGRSVLGLVGRAENSANRALVTLQNPTVTNQEAGNVMADIASIYQSGAPTEFGMKHQEYKTLQQSLASMAQYITGNPQDALPDAVKQRLISVLKGMKTTNTAIFNQQLDLLEKTHPGLIKNHQQEWRDFRDEIGGGLKTGIELDQSDPLNLFK